MAVERLEDIRAIPFSGSRSVLVRETDTLQTLAKRYLGDDELWPFIADLNGLTDNTLLEPGTEILIPIYAGDRVEYIKDRYFLDLNIVKNPYGVDLQIDNEGDIVFNDAGDLAIVGGVHNVLQAVKIKVESVVGSSLKHTSIGLASLPGSEGTDLAMKYIRIHLRSAILQDPRVDSVEDIVIYNRNSVVEATVFFRLVGYDELFQIEVQV